MPPTDNPLLLPLFLLPMVIPLLGVFFFKVRPQRKAERAARRLQSGLTVGDRVVTRGGRQGRVVAVDSDTVEFEGCPNHRQVFERTSIVRRLPAAHRALPPASHDGVSKL